MKRFLKDILRDTEGGALAIFAGALLPMVIVIGCAVDLSFAYMARAKLQNACDAGVLAGRQSMAGTSWTAANETQARTFFGFNFPAGTLGAIGLSFHVQQDAADAAQILGSANASIPTSLMFIFGYDQIPIAVDCDAKRDLGHNDVMLVLDVTASMGSPPAIGGDDKITRLRAATLGLYRALEDVSGTSITRFGIVPYSHSVNVGRSLANKDILDRQFYSYGEWNYDECDLDGSSLTDCVETIYDDKQSTGVFYEGTVRKYRVLNRYNSLGEREIGLSQSTWSLGSGAGAEAIRNAFRTSGEGCIEERPSIGNSAYPIEIEDYVTQADVDAEARDDADEARQFGRYDPSVQEGYATQGCPSEASRLEAYASEAEFSAAINAATAEATGNTYHDIGMLWGARFLSPTGFFASDNPTERAGVPVDRHIVFMTDGKLATSATYYSTFGIDKYQHRVKGSGTLQEKHLARFNSICDLVKANGVTVWVIAFDVTDTDDIDDCATSPAHFYVTDGSDLEDVFEKIGRGIGNLRLTR